jgi:hypothetical protein
MVEIIRSPSAAAGRYTCTTSVSKMLPVSSVKMTTNISTVRLCSIEGKKVEQG